MEAVANTITVILIRMRKQEGVHVGAPLLVPLQALPQLRGYIGMLAVRVVGFISDICVNENPVSTLSFNQGHVAIVHSEKRNLRGHDFCLLSHAANSPESEPFGKCAAHFGLLYNEGLRFRRQPNAICRYG